MPEEKQLDPIEFGFDPEGYLKIKIHMTMGLWNMLGALEEAKAQVMAQFARIAKIEEQKKGRGLIRPEVFNGDKRWS